MPPKRARRRPAAAGPPPPPARGVLRRPAAAVARARQRVEPERWLSELSLEELSALGQVWLKKAIYYDKEVEVVGKPSNVRIEGIQTFMDLKVAGTKDQDLLRVASGRSERVLSVHICGKGCANILSDESLIHGKAFVKVKGDEEPWMSNMVETVPEEKEEDELRKLREEAEKRKAEEKGAGNAPKKEKKKKKSKKEDEDADSGEKAKKGKEKKKRRQEESSEELELGQKSLGAIFSSTGLDPDTKRRGKFTKRAQRIGQGKKKKKKKEEEEEDGSGSSSSSSSSGEEDPGTGLFESERKLMRIWKKHPGALTQSAAAEAQQHLVAASGAMWGVDKRKVNPVFTMYSRQCLVSHMSPPMAQEAITISQVLDLALQGHIASGCDILAQRLKALESSARGRSHWSVSRQMELIKLDGVSIAEDEEARIAARRAREDEKLKKMMNQPQPNRNYENQGGGKGGKQGKDWKGGKKGKTGDAGKGKGGNDKKKEDNKGS